MAEQQSDDHRGERGATRGGAIGIPDVIFAVLALIATLPVLLARYPESADYLNHLARLYVLTAPANDPVRAFYPVHWHLIPNLGLELIAMPLATVLPLELVMKVIWALSVLGMAAAVWFLHRSLYPRTQPTLVLGAIALINLPLTIGLFNFSLGLALALATVGLWFRLGDRATWRSLLMLNVASAVIFVVHLAACASLALTIGALYVVRKPLVLSAVIRRGAVIAIGFSVPALLAILVLLTRAPSETVDPMTVKYIWLWKLELPVAVTFTGNTRVDAIGALALWAALLVALRRGGRCHPRLVAAALIWLVVLLVMPFSIGTATIIDLRQAIFPAMLLIAAFAFAPQKRVWSTVIIAVGVAAVLARAAILLPEWQRHDENVASFRAIDDKVARGAKVLVAAAADAPGHCPEPQRFAPFDEHIPALLTIDRGAFVSTVFAKPGVQPIERAPALRDIAVPDLGIVPWPVLAGTDTIAPVDPWRLYRGDWRKNYDYLALRRLNCPAEIAPEPDLVPIAESATYRLYRIVHGAD